jgi:hypothetical protein
MAMFHVSQDEERLPNGGGAQLNVVLAMTDPGRGTRGISAFLAEQEFPVAASVPIIGCLQTTRV